MTCARWSIPVCLAYISLAVLLADLTIGVDLKPANLLLMAPNLDEIVMHELSEQPSRLYEYPKVFRPKDVPIPPPMSTPLFHVAPGEEPAPLHWVIADFGHGTLARR